LVRVIREHRKEDYLEWVYLDGLEKGVVTTGHRDALWSVADIISLLATQGLSIVGAKDRAAEANPIGDAADATAIALDKADTAVNRSRIARALKLLNAARMAELARREK